MSRRDLQPRFAAGCFAAFLPLVFAGIIACVTAGCKGEKAPAVVLDLGETNLDRRAIIDDPVQLGERTATPDPDVEPDPEPEHGTEAASRGDETAAPAAASGAAVEPGLPMLLDFTRDHCLPCGIMAPWVDELRGKYAGRILIREINIDRPGNKELGAFFKARSIPTQVYVDAEGREVGRHVGLATKAQMERSLERLGFTAPPSGR